MTKTETIELVEARKDILYMQERMQGIQDSVKKLDNTLQNLPDELIIRLDERYAKKHELEEIKETVAPITKFRKRMWQWLIFGVFTIALTTIVLWEIQRFKAS